ncbi:OsmC family protein [Nautilia lithotrophica]
MIKIRHLNDHLYEASNGKDIIIIDPKKYTPIDFFITGLGNCSAYDVVEMAKNKGYELSNFELDIEYKRKDTYPRIFTEFHFIYKFNSNADTMTARRWILSSLETYCSTINTIRNTSKIYYSIILNNDTIAYKESIISGEATHTHEFDDDDDGFGCVA